MGTKHQFLRATAGGKSHHYESVIDYLKKHIHNQTTHTHTSHNSVFLRNSKDNQR